ncbi:DUF7344 domain-containing protein [Natronorarus salvus]|uniref:DUF7344 domain-containing protein n=1 Tax=Natronorarus salvus TaxID=3117733 RepID=UPI002F269176
MATDRETTHSKSELFSILSSHRRRYAIHICKREGGPVSLSDLAEHVAAWELDKDRAELTSAERKRIYTSLQQTHLPTLAESGIIEYDGREAELTEEAERLEVYMDVVPGDSVPWAVYYLGLSAIALCVIVGLWIELIPTHQVPELGWVTALIVLFAASAVVHAYTNQRYRLGAMERPP